jgi:hypothetical protein
MTYDCGYGVMMLIGRRVYRAHLPFPVTLASWRYIFRNWGAK